MMYHTGIYWLDLSMDIGMLLMIVVSVIAGIMSNRRDNHGRRSYKR
jgi:hypothetical protein